MFLENLRVKGNLEINTIEVDLFFYPSKNKNKSGFYLEFLPYKRLKNSASFLQPYKVLIKNAQSYDKKQERDCIKNFRKKEYKQIFNAILKKFKVKKYF